jgi:xyloglucan-specific exo-beta-1,4-glucanase
MRGYITATATGSYTFWIAGDDNSELWLSINDNPENKVKIGWVSEWTDSRQWNKFSTQKSPTVTLTEGQRYYVEALQKEGGGGDNLAVSWAKPGESTSAPSEVIPGSVLSPFSGSSQ